MANAFKGIQIRSYSAAVLYEYDKGIREKLSYKKAMFPPSLFSQWIQQNGLRIHNGKFTRDIICVCFDFGCLDFDGEQRKLKYKLEHCDEKDREFYENLQKRSLENKDKYERIGFRELREKFYTEGIEIKYPNETIKYFPLYRSTSKAKKGECLFINEKLLYQSEEFMSMGIEMPEKNAPLVEMAAYSSLIASGIENLIHIDPENILVIKDVDSFIQTKVISVETDQDKHCFARTIEDYKLKNVLFDGQALIDTSIFPEWAEGYILLRHHFCKMAAFHANIQQFFQDTFKDEYETTYLEDYWGNRIRASDVLLITTENAMKWMKFGVTYQQWSDKIKEANGAYFGIVKTAHKSKFGDVQRMSYQMINALNLQSMDSVIKTSKEYIMKLKSDDEVFINYLKDNSNFANDFDALIALYNHNPMITQSSFFRTRRSQIISDYLKEFKNGRVLQNADNLVIVGSPYAQLLAAAQLDPFSDPTFETESGAVQCCTRRFNDGEYLASFRSPFNSQNNLCCLHNVHHPLMDKYFHIGSQCIAVNLIGTDFQARNNGSDQDSDSIYTTNHPDIVEWAKVCVEQFPTIDNNIPKEANCYDNTPQDRARADTKLADANIAIGVSSNMAQLGLTYSFNFDDEKYKYYTCILSVLAQVAIDNAKRSYDIDLVKEIDRIKKDLSIKENGMPLFWFHIKRKGRFAKVSKDQKQYANNLNQSLVCPMNYLCETGFPRYRSSKPTIEFKNFIKEMDHRPPKRRSMKVEQFITDYSIDFRRNALEGELDELFVEEEFSELIKRIQKLYISKDYKALDIWLLNRAFNTYRTKKPKTKLHTNQGILVKTLYAANPNAFLECFKTEQEMKEEGY